MDSYLYNNENIKKYIKKIGNPGVPQFYERFIRRLRSACEDRHVEIPTLVGEK